jgi:hypothetical protein
MSTRNVLNAHEVDRFVDDLTQQTDRPELRRWLSGSARRWILKHHDLYDRIVRDPATGGLAPVDVSGLRAERHAALRRRLNRAKRRELGRRARPAKAHSAVRRLLDDARRDYVL